MKMVRRKEREEQNKELKTNLVQAQKYHIQTSKKATTRAHSQRSITKCLQYSLTFFILLKSGMQWSLPEKLQLSEPRDTPGSAQINDHSPISINNQVMLLDVLCLSQYSLVSH